MGRGLANADFVAVIEVLEARTAARLG